MANIPMIDFDDRVVVSTHVDVPHDADSKFFEKWHVSYVSGSCEAALSTKAILIYDEITAKDVEVNYPIIKVTDPLVLQLDKTRYDWDYWNIYFKYYGVQSWSKFSPATWKDYPDSYSGGSASWSSDTDWSTKQTITQGIVSGTSITSYPVSRITGTIKATMNGSAIGLASFNEVALNAVSYTAVTNFTVSLEVGGFVVADVYTLYVKGNNTLDAYIQADSGTIKSDITIQLTKLEVYQSPVLKSGYRLVYNTTYTNILNRSTPIKADSSGRITLPVGEYGFKGWEILMVSKNKMTLKDRYRTSVDGTESNFFEECKLYAPTETHFEAPTIVEGTEYKGEFQSLKAYSIPYFNVNGRAINGLGYNSAALEVQEPSQYTTAKEVSPFASTKPVRYNYTKEPQIIFNDIQIALTRHQKHTFSLQNKTLIVDGSTYALNDGDEVCLYKFPLQWKNTQKETYTLNADFLWINRTPAKTENQFYIDTYQGISTSLGTKTEVYLHPSTVAEIDIIQDKYESVNKLLIYRFKEGCEGTLTNFTDFNPDDTAALEVTSNVWYSHGIFNYKQYQYTTVFTSDHLSSNYEQTHYFYVGDTPDSGDLSPGYKKIITLSNVPYFIPDKDRWNDGSFITPVNLLSNISIKADETTVAGLIYTLNLIKSASNVMVPSTYLIQDDLTYQEAASFHTRTLNSKVGLITTYNDTSSIRYFYALIIWRA